MGKPKPIQGVEGEFEPLEPKDDSGLGAFMDATKQKFIDIERLTKAILSVAFISLVGIVVAVSGLVLDQMHFNNQTYTQQANRDEDTINELKEEVKALKVQNDKIEVLTQTINNLNEVQRNE